MKANLTDACEGCPGRCCTRRFWGYIHLTTTESRSPVFRGKLGITTEGDTVLTMGVRTCHFLGKDGRCSIYEQRPIACRGYVCHDGDEHSKNVIEGFPALKRHLKRKSLI